MEEEYWTLTDLYKTNPADSPKPVMGFTQMHEIQELAGKRTMKYSLSQ